jgi:hypothetical protein
VSDEPEYAPAPATFDLPDGFTDVRSRVLEEGSRTDLLAVATSESGPWWPLTDATIALSHYDDE